MIVDQPRGRKKAWYYDVEENWLGGISEETESQLSRVVLLTQAEYNKPYGEVVFETPGLLKGTRQ